MDESTKAMVRGWVRQDGKEGAARFMKKLLGFRCSIGEARAMVAEACAGTVLEG